MDLSPAHPVRFLREDHLSGASQQIPLHHGKPLRREIVFFFRGDDSSDTYTR